MVEIAKFSLHLSPVDRVVGGKNASSNLMPLADEMRGIWGHNVHPEGYAGPRDCADHLQALRGRQTIQTSQGGALLKCYRELAGRVFQLNAVLGNEGAKIFNRLVAVAGKSTFDRRAGSVGRWIDGEPLSFRGVQLSAPFVNPVLDDPAAAVGIACRPVEQEDVVGVEETANKSSAGEMETGIFQTDS
jgi:hypothetical protein